MKRIGLTLLTIATLVACNSDPKKTDTPASTDKPAADAGPSSNPDYAPGLELAAANDCATCHKPYEVLTGPSYQDIANKYAADAPGVIPKLAEKNHQRREWCLGTDPDAGASGNDTGGCGNDGKIYSHF